MQDWKHHLTKSLPLLVFGAVLLIGLGVTRVVYQAEERANQARFEIVADEAVGRVRERVKQHIALLHATYSFFAASEGVVTRRTFEAFVDGLDLDGDFRGIRGMGFARIHRQGEEQLAESDLFRHYGIARNVWPQTDQTLRASIVLLEPQDPGNRVALGYDMFSEKTRRTAIEAAMATGEPKASAPITLVQEIGEEQQAGFLVYFPLDSHGETSGGAGDLDFSGLVYAPFRAGDLFNVARGYLERQSVVLQARDVTEEPETLLFLSHAPDVFAAAHVMDAQRTIDVAGRSWLLEARRLGSPYSLVRYPNTFAVAIVAFLLAAALAVAARYQQMAVMSATKLQALSVKAAQDKDFMLQEMKHRLKNSIARILAIARQTATTAETVKTFNESFSARLQAMANAQDMLTRSRWLRADLHELLREELEQIFGDGLNDDAISGPKVDLDERTTQALGLTFHELATNAMKYGGMSPEGDSLTVTWHIEQSGDDKTLVLDWQEKMVIDATEPPKSGFGTRLIEANIRSELGGTIDRLFGPDGMRISIAVPHPE